jgi:endonuclease YncB( thermonuclease family)
VVDGDTVEIHGKRIRLFGIDAVESGQRCQKGRQALVCGRESAFALADRIGERAITCSGGEFDRYRRLVRARRGSFQACFRCRWYSSATDNANAAIVE